MNIYLVVLNYNNFVETIDFLNGTIEIELIKKIVVVDNFSTNESYIELHKYINGLNRKCKDKLVLLKAPYNGGYSYGNNIGLRYAVKEGAEIIIISNPDCRFNDKTIENIYSFYKKSNKENIGVVAPRNYKDFKENKDSAWKVPTVGRDILDSFLILKKFFNKQNRKLLKECNYLEVEVLSGSFFAISAYAIQKINYLDENIFLYCEERILFKKLSDIGLKSYELLDSCYLHKESTSISQSANLVKKYKMLFESRLYYYKKYENINGGLLYLVEALYGLSLLEKKILDSYSKKFLRGN